MLFFSVNLILVLAFCWYLFIAKPNSVSVFQRISVAVFLLLIYAIAAARGEFGSDSLIYGKLYYACNPAGDTYWNCPELARFEPAFRAILFISRKTGINYTYFQALALMPAVIALYVFFKKYAEAFPFLLVMSYGLFHLQLDYSTIRQSLSVSMFILAFSLWRGNPLPILAATPFHYSAVITAFILPRAYWILSAAAGILFFTYVGADIFIRYVEEGPEYLYREQIGFAVAAQIGFFLLLLFWARKGISSGELFLCFVAALLSFIPVGVRFLPYTIPVLAIGLASLPPRMRVLAFVVVCLGSTVKFYDHLRTADAKDGIRSVAEYGRGLWSYGW